MAVVINEFEVVAEPPPEPPSNPTNAGGGEAVFAPTLKPEDLHSVLVYLRERRARVWAD
ncbi:MAG: hypothetical protein HC853_10500 [Anaerolineae bacterium]|nr:hypothetical protein [Anaerolineae bacterium]